MSTADVSKFVKEFQFTKIGILIDDEPDVARAVIFAPAAHATPKIVNKVITLSGGLLFAALSQERISAFMLTPMARPTSHSRVAASPDQTFAIFTSVEAREGVTTGISASDRSVTLQVLGEESPSARRLVQPGHIFPVETRDGGSLVKSSLPEGCIDLVTMAGYTDAAAFVEIIDTNGRLPSLDVIYELAQKNEIPTLTLSSLIRYRLETEPLVHRIAEARLPTLLAGELRSYIYRSSIHGGEHLALVKGTIDPEKSVLTRVQPEFTFADVFGGDTPPSRQQLHKALKLIGEKGTGVLIYLRRPSSGQLKDQITNWEVKYNEKPASMMREYGLGAQILRDLGVRKIELLTSSTKILAGLSTFGIEIVNQLSLDSPHNHPELT